MKKGNGYRIDPDRLKSAFRRRDITATEATQLTGYSPTYFSVCNNHMYIPARGALLLEKVLGIKPEEYVISDGTPAVASTEPVNDGIDYDRVRGIVYEAVKAAMEEMLK